MKTKMFKFFLIPFLATAVLLGGTTAALSDMMIMPIRVVFKDRDRLKSITVVNRSNEERVYRIETFNQRQLETGGYETIPEGTPIEFDLAKMLTFSPRQVKLPAQGKQTVRLTVRRPENLPDGEYRTHIAVGGIANPNPQSRSKTGARAVVGMNVSIGVPVILRKGAYDATARITNIKVVPPATNKENDGGMVEMTLERSGKHGTLGKLELYHTPVGGRERLVGEANSLNVFTDVTKRYARVFIRERGISGGEFRLVYQGADADKGILFDEKRFPAP